MLPEEFSNGFDTLVDSYRRFKDFDKQEILDSIEFNEYEKSFFLTEAQDEFVVALYNGRNPLGESFEQTEELRRYLSNLIAEAERSPMTNTSGKPIGVKEGTSFFTLPDNPPVLFITYESVEVEGTECENLKTLEVKPVSQDEYHRIKKNPFRGANSRRALRLDLADDVVEIVSKYTLSKYYVRYIRRPEPIILENLPEGLTVGNKSNKTPCELPDILHGKILELAVRMALQSKGIGMSNNTNTKDNKD